MTNLPILLTAVATCTVASPLVRHRHHDQIVHHHDPHVQHLSQACGVDLNELGAIEHTRMDCLCRERWPNKTLAFEEADESGRVYAMLPVDESVQWQWRTASTTSPDGVLLVCPRRQRTVHIRVRDRQTGATVNLHHEQVQCVARTDELGGVCLPIMHRASCGERGEVEVPEGCETNAVVSCSNLNETRNPLLGVVVCGSVGCAAERCKVRPQHWGPQSEWDKSIARLSSNLLSRR